MSFEQIKEYLITIPAVLLVIMFHELAHGVTANRLGDPTAQRMGRLTLNPLKHLDPIGTVCMVLFRFGWAKPVPVNPGYFRNPKRGMAITALAGPLSNFLLAFLAIPLCFWAQRAWFEIAMNQGMASFAARFLDVLCDFLAIFHFVNLGLGLFNLIPLPPLDGSRVLFSFLPDKYYFSVMRYERYIALGLMLFILLGANFGFLNKLSGMISMRMQDFWRLLPIF
jgi:Zn-dependent protease